MNSDIYANGRAICITCISPLIKGFSMRQLKYLASQEDSIAEDI